MTTADKLRKEGKLEGKLEGKIEGKKERDREIALKMLEEGLPEDKILRITGIRPSEVLRPAKRARTKKTV